MNSLHDSRQSGSESCLHGRRSASSSQDETQAMVRDAIQDYLDYLGVPLLGIVPYRQRRRLLAEAEDHLHGLTEDFLADGFTAQDAVAAALREYGDPWHVGQSFADAWSGAASTHRLSCLADAATLRAFGWFGVLTVLNLLIIEWCVLLPSPSYLFLMEQCLAIASPFVAGAFTGAAMHAQTPSGVCRAIPLLSLASVGVGFVLSPHTEGLTFALFQIVFWLPIGCLSATVAASLRRQFGLQGFRHPKERTV